MKERTLILIKPDGVKRRLAKTILKRILETGLTIQDQKELTITEALARKHYAEHIGKPFFHSLLQYITSGPVIALVVEGENAISCMRELIGPTNPKNAPPGTIRGDLRDPTVSDNDQTMYNLIHGSDSPSSAARELSLFFPN